MSKPDAHLETLMADLSSNRFSRREFVRLATLLGMSATAAYAAAGLTPRLAPIAWAQQPSLPKGGTLRIGSRVKEIKSPHTYSWGAWDSNMSRQVVEYLTFTDENNVTHPYLLEKWEVSPDLKTWTLFVRKDVKWRNGKPFTSDDVIWNLKRVLDPDVGSSVVGLMKGYMLEEVEVGGRKTTRLWDSNAIERVDDHTVRLNCKVPQVAVPEHLFHYPLPMLYPQENGVLGPGSMGTGPFDLTDFEQGKRAVFKARKDYWGNGPYLDGVEFIDMGDDPAAAISALASKQVHGLVGADPVQYDALKRLAHLQLYEVATAETAVLRFKVTEKPFDDPRVRKAMRLAVDNAAVMQIALRGLGLPGDNTHVSPAQPDFMDVGMQKRDVAAAKKLLAEAGHPNGIDAELSVPADPPWNVSESLAAVEQWKEAGIRVRMKVLPGAQYWEVWTKVPMGCTIWYHRPLGVMVLGLAYRSGVPWNESGYSSPEFDRILTEAEGTLDIAKRRELIGRLQKMMQEDGPIVQPLWRKIFTFYDKRVQGFRMHPSNYVFCNQLALQQA
jgi:peptide/nickel transport system substrate-binding protein